jgi:hypothetical protein
MQSNWITQNQVGELWGYKGSHETIRTFLHKHSTTATPITVGKRPVVLYERAEIMRLADLYRKSLAEIAMKRDERAHKMGLARQSAIRAARVASPGVSAAVRNMIYDLTVKLDTLENRMQSLEDDLGVKKP